MVRKSITPHKRKAPVASKRMAGGQWVVCGDARQAASAALSAAAGQGGAGVCGGMCRVCRRQTASKALSATAEQRVCAGAVCAGSPVSAAGGGRFAYCGR